MKYKEFVEKYYDIASFPALWKELLLFTVLNLPFFIYAKIKDSNLIYIVPWIIIFFIFFIIVSNLDFSEQHEDYKRNPSEFLSSSELKLRLSAICSCIYQVLSLGILYLISWSMPIIRLLFDYVEMI